VCKVTLELRRMVSIDLDTPNPVPSFRLLVQTGQSGPGERARSSLGAILTRSCQAASRPTDAPLKKAPSAGICDRIRCRRTTAGERSRCEANEYPTLAFTMKLGSTCVDLLKSNRPDAIWPRRLGLDQPRSVNCGCRHVESTTRVHDARYAGQPLIVIEGRKIRVSNPAERILHKSDASRTRGSSEVHVSRYRTRWTISTTPSIP